MTTKMTIIGMLVAAAISAGFSSQAKALTYVNLLDDPTMSSPRPVNSSRNPNANAGANMPEPLPEPLPEPVSLSYGATSGAPQTIANNNAAAQAQVSAVQAATQRAAQFNQWAIQMQQARQNAELQMRQSVAALDQAINQQWQTRERARYNYQHTAQESDRQAYFTAQAAIEQIQRDRWYALTTYTTYIYNNINQLYSYDPNQTANLSWYQGQLAANQNFYNTALAQAQGNFGLKNATN